MPARLQHASQRSARGATASDQVIVHVRLLVVVGVGSAEMIDAIGKLARKVLAESLLALAQIRVRSRVLLSPGLCLVRAPTYPNARRADSRALQAYRRGKSRGRSKLARGVQRCPNILADAPPPCLPAQSCPNLQ